jgi:phage terminase large subunit GpA-like protein
MSLLTAIDPSQLQAVERHLAAGLKAWGVAEPVTLEAWAREHFYLSAESSYVEQRWTPWPFQRGIMACISNDDVEEVTVKKSARVGYTKILLAAIGYFAEHKRRNQCIWQPTDDDADDFAKSELDPMLRDVEVMRGVFPTYLARHKDNTLQQKRFIGSILRIRGGKAAKNYRRISIDVAYGDELSAFDADVEKEGSPSTLMAKRVEGATFPKFVNGSTPKLKGFCLIEERSVSADERFTFQIACPHCGHRHGLTWGGKDEPHGFKFDPAAPENVVHMCPKCTVGVTQAEYLAVADAGLWVNEAGDLHLHVDGRFTRPDGTAAPTPRHVAFHVWTAYSPVVPWAQIVREFLAAHEKLMQGDDSKMKAWTNTTRGEAWEGEIESTEADDLKARAEPLPLKSMPRGCLLALCAIDTQDNRLEAGVWGIGRGGEMWTIEHQVFFGNPAQSEVWEEAERFLRETRYMHASGLPQPIFATAVDSGGHHADAVYAFAHKLKGLRVHAIKGASQRERAIDNGNTRVGYKWNGKVEKHGPVLWIVGTNLCKDRFHSRLAVQTPGPGYVHLSKDFSDEWFKQLAGEVRAVRRQAGTSETRWSPKRKRVEVKDCVTYVVWLEERLNLWAPGRAKWWDELERVVQPPDDLFASLSAPAALASAPSAVSAASPAALAPAPRAAPRSAARPKSRNW